MKSDSAAGAQEWHQSFPGHNSFMALVWY